mgnify:CR=1 FL=1
MLNFLKKITSKYVIVMIYISFIISKFKLELKNLMIILVLSDILWTILLLYVEEIIFCKDKSVWESVKTILLNVFEDIIYLLFISVIIVGVGNGIKYFQKDYNLESCYRFSISVGCFLILYSISIYIKQFFTKIENEKIEKNVINKIEKDSFFKTLEQKCKDDIFNEVHMKVTNTSNNKSKNDEYKYYLEIVDKFISDEREKENNTLIKKIFKNYKLILSLIILIVIGIISGFGVEEKNIFEFLTFNNLKNTSPILYLLLIIIL